MAIIKIDDLLLRPVQESDTAALVDLLSDREISRNTARICHPYTQEMAKEFVASSLRDEINGDEFRFAVTRNDSLIGMCGVSREEQATFETGYWVGASYRRQGVATLAARAVTQFAFEILKADCASAGYFIDNPASGRVLERVGYVRTGETVRLYSAGRGCEVETVRMAIKKSQYRLSSDIVIDLRTS